MDNLLMKLSEQQAILAKQKAAMSSGFNEGDQARHQVSSDSSAILTPTSDVASKSNKAFNADSIGKMEDVELDRLKKELDAAKNEIARQKYELDQNRVIKHTVDQAMGPSSEATLSPRRDQFNDLFNNNVGLQPESRQTWMVGDDARSDFSNFDAVPGSWGNRSGYTTNLQSNLAFESQAGRPWSQRGARNSTLPTNLMNQPTSYTAPLSPRDGRGFNDFASYTRGGFGQPQQFANRRGAGLEIFGPNVNQIDAMSVSSLNSSSPYPSLGVFPTASQPQPIGTSLSPIAAEFQVNQTATNPWNAGLPSSPTQTYISPMEPLNYRRLLDRNVTCNWKYIVDKIVCNNDQQTSIFLQQKLKVGTAEQKYEIIEAIVAQAYPLMVNRFGNFLVQRCFEHGTPEQVVAIANAIRGNTLSLSMDPFGCHVVQKAFDAVPEDYKAIMVHELLRRIPETVIHRYACHVWQKLFELRWSDSPPQIMKYVNEALRGMWHEVALGETGSLVVQNIFENCLEEDKRPCIDEVLLNIDIVSHGQFGNWCIQHICEHGLPADRSRAIDHVLRYATEYSMDQFASKVVEKCLKIGGSDFLERYLERVCEGRADRPRIPLIDSMWYFPRIRKTLTTIIVASDQYGNYLIQFILTHANPNHREIVASHIR